MVCFWYNLIDLHMSAHLLLKFRFRVEFFDFRVNDTAEIVSAVSMTFEAIISANTKPYAKRF
jgi:hypothetical protein